MRTNLIKFLILALVIPFFSSCLWDDETVLSTNPTFVSLKFAANDSVPNIEDAVFTLELDSFKIGDSWVIDSVIVNLDSLPYQTRIDTVNPTFSFKSSSGAYLLMYDSARINIDTVGITGKDTIDFSRVISVTNTAEDKLTKRTYRIKVNVHQVEPELYQWERKVSSVFTHSGSNQKAILYKNKFLYFVSSGPRNYLYTSADASSWSPETLTGMPNYPELRNITVFNNVLYYVHEDGKIYSSSDGISWTGNSPGIAGHTLINLLFELNNNLWSIVKNNAGSRYYFATTSDGITWSVGDTIPDEFPVSSFAALSFKSRTNKPRAVILGGFSSKGELLRDIWSVEKNVYNVNKWVNFSLENTSLVSLAGASIIHYDDKLLLFGGMDIDDEIIKTPYMQSIDEGLSWQKTDTTYNTIRDTTLQLIYEPRSYQSVIHREDTHQIFLIGGRNRTSGVFSDVWVGKLNRLSFILQ